MGRKSSTGGVRPKGDRIQLDFMFQGQRCRPTLDMKPTNPNRLHATRLVRDIIERIRHGTFDLGKEFPDYQGLERFNAKQTAVKVKTFAEYVDLWRAANTKLSPSTLQGYEKIFKRNWIPWFGDRLISNVLPSEIAAKIGETTESRKSYNNILSQGRIVFALAVKDGAIAENPAKKVDFLKLQDSEPDPFALDEVELILPRLAERWGPEIADYYEFAFFTGMRPNEQIEVQWPDVDLRKRTARISRGRVVNTVKDTKTYEARTIEFHSRAYAALLRQKARSYLAGKHVWLSPFSGNGRKIGEPWLDEHRQGLMFGTAIKLLGIRHRPAKNTRQTYATIMLMSAANPRWAAGQLGHSIQVFHKTYAAWIDKQDAGRELAKVQAYTDAGSIPGDAIDPKKQALG